MGALSPGHLTGLWMRAYNAEIAKGAGRDEAIRRASRQYPCEGKGRSRIRLASGITLTLPVEGGAKGLRTAGADPVLSEHGKWRREHLGALLALYGRTAWYIHLIPRVEALYDKSCGMRLSQFAEGMLQIALSVTDTQEMLPSRLRGAAEEAGREMEGELSIFDALFRLGRGCTLAWGNL